MPTEVTVVIPVYNAARTLRATLDSLLSQTFGNWQAIIVDDGTPDHSIDIVKSYNEPRFRVVHQDNLGLNGARNTGIRHADTPFIAFLDADDIWMPEKLERHMQHFAECPDVGISYSPSALIANDGTPLGLRQRPKLRRIRAKDVICRNPIGNGSAAVFRRAVFNDIAFRRAETPEGGLWWFDETFRQSTDIECWMRIVAQSDWRFEGVSETLVQYRVSVSGLSANTDRQLENWEKALRVLERIRPDLACKWGRLARAYQLRYLARRQVSARNGRKALSLIVRALGTDGRILLQEPLKTLTTLGAAVLLISLGGVFSASERQRQGV